VPDQILTDALAPSCPILADRAGLEMIEVGESEQRAAVPGLGLLRSHAAGLPCRSMELPYLLLHGGRIK